MRKKWIDRNRTRFESLEAIIRPRRHWCLGRVVGEEQKIPEHSKLAILRHNLIHDTLCLLATWSWSLASSANFLPQSTSPSNYFWLGTRTSIRACCSEEDLSNSATPAHPGSPHSSTAPLRSASSDRSGSPGSPGMLQFPLAASSLYSHSYFRLW